MPLSALARLWTGVHPTRLARETERLRRDGVPLLDLTASTAHDPSLEFPHDSLVAVAERVLREAPTVRRYSPDPLGQPPGREAIAEFYARRGVPADPARIVLTPGTSQAYLYALKLLVNPGEEILVPTPGYPLFDDLCAICGVSVRRYHLAERGGVWRVDLDDLAFQITPRTRAVMAVSPHNPLGCVLTADELSGLGAICRGHGLPLVFDEVFAEFLSPKLPSLPRPRPEEFPLVITLNGFSKMFALPGWKIAWMKVDGEPSQAGLFLRALEHLADTFLPLSELAQAMIPGLFEAGDPAVCGALSREIADRRRLAADLLAPRVCDPGAGVYLCPVLPAGVDDDEFTLHALREHRLLVHPGHLYGLPEHLVMTCLAPRDALRRGAQRLTALLEATGGRSPAA